MYNFNFPSHRMVYSLLEFIRRSLSAQSYPSSWPGPNSKTALSHVHASQKSFLEQMTKLQAFYSSCGFFWPLRDMKVSELRNSPSLLEDREAEEMGMMQWCTFSYPVTFFALWTRPSVSLQCRELLLKTLCCKHTGKDLTFSSIQISSPSK